jgi:pyrroline-5-carboxylate reductase
MWYKYRTGQAGAAFEFLLPALPEINSLEYMNITFIGGGNMACALIGGLLQQDYSPAQIRVAEINAETRERVRREFGVEAVAELARGMTGDRGIIVLAVKPQQLSIVARGLAPLLKQNLVISIAAGIRAETLSQWFGGHARIVRAMPNTPALVGSGVTGLYAMAGVNDEEKSEAETILRAVGTVLWVESEELLNAVTATSGSGPAYVFYFIEAMQKAGQELGLDADQTRKLSIETFLGAAKLASESRDEASVLRARVTSPGGTTERAIKSLENDDVKNGIIRAIRVAYQRSREMGDELSRT